VAKAVTGDTGEYSCQAENPYGKDFTHCRVSVIDGEGAVTRRLKRDGGSMLVVTRPLSDLTLHEGHRGVLECECQAAVEMAPPVEVEWYRDGKLVAVSKTLRTYFDGRMAMLKLFEARAMEHNGEYECRFITKAGIVMSKARVTVEGECG
jgi:hypothetical protein